jgi:hypothetical protein
MDWTAIILPLMMTMTTTTMMTMMTMMMRLRWTMSWEEGQAEDDQRFEARSDCHRVEK